MEENNKRLKRICKVCGISFRPIGKFCYLCEDCLKKALSHGGRRKKNGNKMPKMWIYL